MSIKNISIQTYGLHVGESNYAVNTNQQFPYKETGVLTCSGISIFGDCSKISGKAAVTIGTVDSVSKLPFSDSLYVLGTSKFFADMLVSANVRITADARINGTTYSTFRGSINVQGWKGFDIKHPTKENHKLHSGTPTIGYVIAILKEIEALNLAKIPNRKILVLLAGKEQITDNVSVMQSIHRYAFINTATINKAQHEILIEKEEIRQEALTLIHEFLKS